MNAALQLAMHSIIDDFVARTCAECKGGHILKTLNQVELSFHLVTMQKLLNESYSFVFYNAVVLL